MRGRFSTSKNESLPILRYFNLPKALYLAILRKYFNKYPVLPWIPFSAIKNLDKIIKPNWTILEVGAGMSTLWLSKKGGKVISIEADKNWFENLSRRIKSEGIKNIDLRYEWEAEKMSNFDEFPDLHFDLIYIDGGPRELCCLKAPPKVKKGGYIYLDNSDNEELSGNSSTILKNLVKDHPEKLIKHIDFVPGNFMINEGALIQLI
ncbi:signal recognition particle subunit FFH/SRP54 (srp54) [Pedobacter agri]|uniref:Class I SAM-dependent methyltransferase n=1 Tax=Pedobacter agri TaxID=454586 RepID=A0A9X3DAL0_9SPHI|nr:signal recognition particle subunit FFH/SRP54 (srp54) [Pedobacter agri]MCX3263645.1 hypothetical protein [Pedobacter agri]